MRVISYRDHLEVFTRIQQEKVSYSKIFFSFFVILTLAIVFTFGVSTLKNRNLEPANNQAQYLEGANSSFFKTQQSLSDTLSSFKVAGAKIEKINSLESTPTPGYFITLGEVQKTIANIKDARLSIENEEALLKKEPPPEIYSTLNTQIFEYLTSSKTFLEALEKKHSDLKDLIIAAGPNFYLPVLSNETIWESQDREKIKEYYTNRKEEAEKTMLTFAQVPTNPDLEEFKELQISYFQLFINLSENVLKVLEKSDSLDPDSANSIEEAYQVLAGAKRENELITAGLLKSRQQLTNSLEFTKAIGDLNDQESLIESGFAASNTKIVSRKKEALGFQEINSGLYKVVDDFLK